MSEDRIIELEIKMAYQEELLDALNGVVARQQNQIDRLEETCRILHDKLKSLSHTEAKNNPLQEIPPHY